MPPNPLTVAIAIALKDLLRFTRSSFALGMMLGAPLLLTGLLYAALGHLGQSPAGVPPAPMTLVVADLDQPVPGHPALGAMLVASFRHPSVQSWLTLREESSEAAARTVASQASGTMGVVIPEDFSRALFSSGEVLPLRLLTSGAADASHERTLRAWLQLFLDSVTASRVALDTAEFVSREMKVPLAADTRAELSRRQSTFLTTLLQRGSPTAGAWLEVRQPTAERGTSGPAAPPVLAIVCTGLLLFFIFFTAGHAAQSITLEAGAGTLARLFTTPSPRGVILCGKSLAVFGIVGGQAAALLGLSSVLLGIPWGPMPRLALLGFGVVVGAGGFGVLLVALASNTRQSGIIVSTVSASAGMLGGLFTGAVRMPAAFELAGTFVPQGWAMRGFELLLAGAPTRELLGPTVALLSIGTGSLVVGIALLRRRFA
jgi:ABC-2 type transport system permease protein